MNLDTHFLANVSDEPSFVGNVRYKKDSTVIVTKNLDSLVPALLMDFLTAVSMSVYLADKVLKKR